VYRYREHLILNLVTVWGFEAALDLVDEVVECLTVVFLIRAAMGRLVMLR
jgi:hypothetical protein